jgi:molecular chaperone DnaK
MAFIGIDLGTTFSAVATVDETGRPIIIENKDKRESGGCGNLHGNITPSCIALDRDGSGGYSIGQIPRQALNLDDDAIGRFKRDMGTNKIYKLGGKELSPTDCSALILNRMRKIAEDKVGNISSAVVTVPANFTNEAREATLAAAKKAGLNVEHIINEPTAAAFYYAFKSGKELSGNYVIYDLGGGTFDVTIMKINGKEIEVLCSNGVSTLGGDDFDQLLVNLVQKKYKDITGLDLDPSEYTKTNAELDKITLSSNPQCLAKCDEIGGEMIHIKRAEFEDAISSLIAQTEMLCESTLDEAGIDVSDITEVILAGGSTRIPAVRKSISSIFSKKPLDDENVDEVVALGAALYAAYKSDRADLNAAQSESISSINLSEITNYCFGTTALARDPVSGEMVPTNFIVIAKNRKIPASDTQYFQTISQGQTSIDCDVTQCVHEETDPAYVKKLWAGSLEGLPPNRPAGQKIEVTYAFNGNGIMECSFKDVASGMTETVQISTEASKSDENDSVFDELLFD